MKSSQGPRSPPVRLAPPPKARAPPPRALKSVPILPASTPSHDLDLIRRSFPPAPGPPDPLPPGSASVLAPIVDAPGGPYILLERRPAGPSPFAGQLSFPGGRIEADDATPLAAALREAREEVGFRAEDVEVVGPLAGLDNHLGRHVVAFVGILPLAAVPAIPASPAEVEEVLLVPLAGLRNPGDALDPEAPPLSYRPLSYESRFLAARQAPIHYWALDPPPARPPAVLWGLTAELVARMLSRLWGWTPPSAPRAAQGWQDLRP